MPADYWYRQTLDQPLFSEMLWSRPENRSQAGRLMIAGGSLHGFAVPAEAYAAASKAGVGTARVLLPDALQKPVGLLFEAGEYAPSTPSGSFSRQALAVFMDCAAWADGVLLAGEFGRNSETAILLESFVSKHHGQLTITRDALDYFVVTPGMILNRADTTLVLSMAQLQKLFMTSKQPVAITFDMGLSRLTAALHDFTQAYPTNIIVRTNEHCVIAVDGSISSTDCLGDKPVWRVTTAAAASVWWLQNPSQTFKALTTSLIPAAQ
ncbi:MAG: uncharacterized protein JWM37_240 [Candidatus Saccharibacteria bacterium]|nr:uncharacterized protein [Candidatus Saccharibacteria bacterium]